VTFSCRENSDKFIVNITDKSIFDEAQIQKLGHDLLDICKKASASAKKMIIDFRGVQFISSAMCSTLLQVNKFARENSVDLCLANVGPSLRQIFKLTRLTRMFRFDDENPDSSGSRVGNPIPPSTLDGGAEPQA
jgi:anti-anti-sigma factor